MRNAMMWSLLKARKFTDALGYLENHHPDLSVTDEDGNSPLHLALKGIHEVKATTDLIKKLLAMGAKPNLKNHHGQTPLHLISPHPYRNFSDFASPLMDAGANIDERDNEGKTYLFQLSGRHDKDEKLQECVDLGARPDIPDFMGRNLLFNMIKSGNHSVSRLDYLINLGLDPKAVDHSGNTLLHEALLCKADVKIMKELLELGLDLDQKNFVGRSPVHILCSLGPFNHVTSKLKDYLHWVLSQSNNINAVDNYGITPLHLASTVSEFLVDELLKAGADPTLATFEGLTALHLACRARQSNIVGMLVTALSNADPLKGATYINAKDENRWTPLFHACLSGRPESVAVLLQAGADPTITAERKSLGELSGLIHKTVFEVCLRFEEEQDLWRDYGKTSEVNDEACELLWKGGKGHLLGPHPCAAGLRPKDTTRPFVSKEEKQIMKYSGGVLTCHDTTRMEEILDMLVAQVTSLGKDVIWMNKAIKTNFHQALIQHGYGYMFRCFDQLWKKHQLEEPVSAQTSRSFNTLALQYQQESMYRVLNETDSIQPGSTNYKIFIRLLKEREYRFVETLFARGTDFLARFKENMYLKDEETHLHFLAIHGFGTLLDRIGSLVAEAKFNEGQWHAAGKPTRSGFGFCSSGPGFDHPLLLTACERELPNMEVVRVLVEKLKVEVNAQTKGSTPEQYSDDVGNLDGVSALHHLASGKHWWYVSQGIPYLGAQAGANLELRNENGETPLHVALKSPCVFQKQAAEALIKLGADVNAVDGEGWNCMSLIGRNPYLLDLLQSRGAIVTASVLFGAINGKDMGTLEKVLETGIDPNNRRDGADANLDLAKENGFDWTSISPLEFGMDTNDWYALHYAASTLSDAGPWKDHSCTDEDKEIQTKQIAALLASGADPYAVFRQPIKHPREGDIRYLLPGEDEDSKRFNMYGFFPSEDFVDGDQEIQDDESIDSLIWPDPVHRYGLRSIINALLEDGDAVQTLLELPTLNFEHRDPQGRTLIHSACRSALGADADIGCTLIDNLSSKLDSSINHGENTPLGHLLSRGANPLARDNKGKNALHHLLEAHDTKNYRPPVIIKSLKHMATSFPELLNQPDNQGTYPINAALQRIRRYESMDSVYIIWAGLGTAIEVLLAAGANPHALDGCGNTVLHYLATEPKCIDAEEWKRLFRLVFDQGVDVNLRNKAGRTSISLFFEELSTEKPEAEYDYRPLKEHIDTDMLRWFEEGGVDWDQRDEKGRTLLHLVARQKTENATGVAIECAQFLMGKGIDVKLKDIEGNTALDVATLRGNEDMMKLFKE